ncbi:hybrid sensor histidine kinase/response regulator [Paraburkholderia fungorum]|uniref:hybrid sensor histidine kinase/response regulator n=1 Tax=Paraburkholderia fungorum TaxID=134537 RepID=UPI0020A75007|nr:hybrid sensor histidine kinase/response regulator [Paraburkholderia fungorum]
MVALAGACLSRAALRRAASELHQVEDKWTRRCDAAEAREIAARSAATKEARDAALKERLWLLGAARLYAEAPLAAVTGLLESIDTGSMPTAQRAQMSVLQSAVLTWGQTLRDLLETSPLESRAFVLDESATNLRELIDGVIALLSPSATQRGLHLSSDIDHAVAERILVDSARLGQIFFHLLNHTVQLNTHGEIAIVVRAEPLNAGSQQIFINVAHTGEKAMYAAQGQLFEADASEPREGKQLSNLDACLALCQILAQRMQGELAIASDSHSIIRASFNAPFTVEQWGASADQVRYAHAHSSVAATQPEKVFESVLAEPFEPRYLKALSAEGIDLNTFLSGWRRAMKDDLEQMSDLRHQEDVAELRTLLHRLSGAVGLVGAHSLMEALRRASVAPQEHGVVAVDALIERAEILITELDTEIASHRSTLG